MEATKELTTYDKAQEAAEYIRTKVNIVPEIAFILGSGLGDYADSFENSVAISYGDIPYFKKSTVKGHKGNLVFGTKGGKTIVAMQGRYHFYEGHDMKDIVFPIYVLKQLGVKTLMLTNAAGGINTMLKAGDLMIIRDHINFLGTNPLIGPIDERFGSERFPDMTNTYNKDLRKIIVQCMEKQGIQGKEGVYIAFTGPSYETPAEVQMAKGLGADAVGMSTVPEAIVANSLGIKVGGISCICNMAAGIHPIPLTHKEVCEAANSVKENFKKLLDTLTPQI